MSREWTEDDIGETLILAVFYGESSAMDEIREAVRAGEITVEKLNSGVMLRPGHVQ